jgi:3-dehydroquinate synthase
MSERTVEVPLGPNAYSVRIAPGLIEQVGEFVGALGDVSRLAVVADSNVAELYGPRLMESLAATSLPAELLIVPAGEENKTLATCGKLFDDLFALRPAMDRSSLIVTLGGGVTGDIGGFLAATCLRGVRFLQCSTTLLAAVDASTGGKTGVDHPAGKNLIGAFHQPVGVLIDPDLLESLPAAQLRSGLAECVKHAVIRSRPLLEMLETRAEDLLACRSETMSELIAANVRIKADVVVADEREASLRAILNYGHTFGHAIEVEAGYGRITHGQAVALGMVAANRVAVGRGLLGPDVACRVEEVLKRLDLATRWEPLSAESLWSRMLHDKKTRGGKVKLILPRDVGRVEIHDDLSTGEVSAALEHLCS